MSSGLSFLDGGSARPVGAPPLRRQGERGWRLDASPARFGVVGPDAIAGVMVLSEVAQRLMMMSGADASTSAAGYGRTATSRMNEVATTTVPAGHR
jgi:hypothetical protein